MIDCHNRRRPNQEPYIGPTMTSQKKHSARSSSANGCNKTRIEYQQFFNKLAKYMR